MFTRILTDLERKQLRAYLKADGKKETSIRMLVIRARRHLPTIKADLDLLEKLLATCTKWKTYDRLYLG